MGRGEAGRRYHSQRFSPRLRGRDAGHSDWLAARREGVRNDGFV